MKTGARDTRATAEENLEVIQRVWGKDHGVFLVVDMTRVRYQDADARRYYTDSSVARRLLAGVALVTGNAVSRVVANVYLGVNRGSTPLKLFGSVEDATAWLTTQAEEVELGGG